MKTDHLLTEKEFSQQVVDYARLRRWRVARWPTWRSTGTNPGVPDLLLVRERIIFAELKAGKGKLTPDQQSWLNLLEAAKQEVYIWRPSDWPYIENRLR
mgnify:CR=1 FL=1